MANSLPFLSGVSAVITFDEDALNLGQRLLFPDVTFADNDMNGGTLVLSGLLAEDLVAIRNQGTGVGQIGVDGADVTYGGIVIGTFTGGSGSTLTVAFNAAATSAAVEALIENLTLRNLSGTPTESRQVELNITDAAGANAVGPVLMQQMSDIDNPLRALLGSPGSQFDDFAVYPAFADLDGDGDLDAAVGRYNGTLRYFKNTGTAATPVFVEQTGSANIFGFVDETQAARPDFVDVNNDGKLDLVLARGGLKYFLNNTTGATPSFSATGVAFFQSNLVTSFHTAAFADLDADGDIDVIAGGSDGTLGYYKNPGGSVAGFPSSGFDTAQTGAANPFNGIDVGANAAPVFGDFDRDGDLDAVVGAGDGTLHFFQNVGTNTAPVYVERTGEDNPFGDYGLVGPSGSSGNASPAAADLDGDGDLDILAGAYYGTTYFRNEDPGGGQAIFVQRGLESPLAHINLFDVSFAIQNARPAAVDMDGDGDFDLVVGQWNGTGLLYLENTGAVDAPAYLLRTGSANPMDGLIVGAGVSPAFGDLDSDGDLDLLAGQLGGTLRYFENTGSAAAPAYLEHTGAANPLDGVDVGTYSQPTLGDLDGDGDLDAVVGAIWNSALRYFENTGTTTAPDYTERTGPANPFTPNPGTGFLWGVGSVYEAGAVALADVDGDGDLDLVFVDTELSSADFDLHGDFRYLENTGSTVAPNYVERTGSANPFDGLDIARGSASLADLDGDGDLDAVSGERQLSPSNGDFDPIGLFFGWRLRLEYLENIGSNAAAPSLDVSFAERTGAANPMNGVDVGYYATPVFADLDGDGDFDLVSGHYGAALRYFENTGGTAAPVYVERTGGENPVAAIFSGYIGAIALTDLDGDGDLDLVDGSYGQYFKNTGTATAPVFVLQAPEANPMDGGGGFYGKPAFGDLDGDGDLDAVVGNPDGTLSYKKNIGTSAAPQLYDVVVFNGLPGLGSTPNPFSGKDVGYAAAPALVDLDRDGDVDVVVGAHHGTLHYYENNGTGLMQFVERTGVTNPFNDIDVGYSGAVPAFADLDGDGDLDLMVGDGYGQFLYFENPGHPTTGFTFNVKVEEHTDPSPGPDVIVGTDGDDLVDGLGGADTLIGGVGDDIYVADQNGDSAVELDGEGSDTIHSTAASYVLPAFVEHLLLLGAGDIGGTGNGGDNRIEGNGGNNALDGGAGADLLVGGAGNDRYVVDRNDDQVTELDGEGDDTVQSTAPGYVLSAFVENLLLLGSGNIHGTGNDRANRLDGNSGANSLSGLGGDDVIDGKGGADAMVGGLGNDIYYVDRSDDVVTETGPGTDTVRSSAPTFALAALVENLELLGTGNINGTGNALANTITGNSGNNALNGGKGVDALIGGGGDDTYNVDVAGDLVTELDGEGIDTVKSAAPSFTLGDFVENLILIGTGDIDGTGNDLANIITGNSGMNLLAGGGGNDVLSGGANADELIGGEGDDTYGVDDEGDIVIELDGQGFDTVKSSLTGYTLPDFVEKLILVGTSDIDGTGNGLANTITGNGGMNVLTGGGGNDLLNGGANADELIGGEGDDTYVVDDAGDIVTELDGQGADTVKTTAPSYTLPDFVETLNLLGTGSIDGTGNGGANRLNGNSGDNILNGAGGNDTLAGKDGADTLDGGAGVDVLTGGAGGDRFRFASTDNDRISDFALGVDQIHLDAAVFDQLGAAGVLDAGKFHSAPGAVQGLEADDYVVYNQTNGVLYYDADGAGGSVGVKIATLTGSPDTLAASDIVLY